MHRRPTPLFLCLLLLLVGVAPPAFAKSERVVSQEEVHRRLTRFFRRVDKELPPRMKERLLYHLNGETPSLHLPDLLKKLFPAQAGTETTHLSEVETSDPDVAEPLIPAGKEYQRILLAGPLALIDSSFRPDGGSYGRSHTTLMAEQSFGELLLSPWHIVIKRPTGKIDLTGHRRNTTETEERVGTTNGWSDEVRRRVLDLIALLSKGYAGKRTREKDEALAAIIAVLHDIASYAGRTDPKLDDKVTQMLEMIRAAASSGRLARVRLRQPPLRVNQDKVVRAVESTGLMHPFAEARFAGGARLFIFRGHDRANLRDPKSKVVPVVKLQWQRPGEKDWRGITLEIAQSPFPEERHAGLQWSHGKDTILDKVREKPAEDEP